MIKYQSHFLSFIFICSIGGCSGLEVQAVTQPEPMEEPILNPQTPDMQQPESSGEPAIQPQASEPRSHLTIRVSREIWRQRDPSGSIEGKLNNCVLGTMVAGSLVALGVGISTMVPLERRFRGQDIKILSASLAASLSSWVLSTVSMLNLGYCRKPVRESLRIRKEVRRTVRDMKSSAKGGE